MAANTGNEFVVDAVLGWHRVCLNTIVRATKELESARLRILPMGSRVNVVEVCGRRVRIDQPIDGWCSIESSNGDLILSPTQAEGDHVMDSEGLVTPAVETEQIQIQGRAEQLTKELQELKWLRREVASAQELQRERDDALSELTQNKEILATMEQKATQSQEQLVSLKEQFNELRSRFTGSEDEQQIERIEKLQTERNRVEAELEEISSIAEKRNEELIRLKMQMGHMVNSFQVPSSETSEQTILQNGDVVLMKQGDIVICRWKGNVHWAEESEEYIGVELSDPVLGGVDGSYEGQHYFNCPPGCGQFFRLTDVKKKIPAEFLLQKLHNLMKENERTRTAAE